MMRTSSWRVGFAVGVVTLVAGGLTGVAAASPRESVGDGRPAAARWDIPDASTRTDPAAIVAGAGVAAARKVAGGKVFVTSVRSVRGAPVITREPAQDTQDAVRKIAAAQRSREGLVAVGVDARVRATSNDPYASSQYALTQTMLGGTLDQVRGVSTGAGVTVAVIDTGVDASHPDLAGRVLSGPSILEGVVTAGAGQSDDNNHGSHVAGTIAATTDNQVGVASLASGASVLPIKALRADGTGWDSDIAKGVVYAADQGAKVINLSLGGDGSTAAMRAAVTYAQNKGAVIVAAVGNEALKGNPVPYPAAYPGVVGVGAVDASGNRGSFSNYGPYVDLMAPGVGVLSTVAGGRYGTYSGTSMAAPSISASLAVLAAAAPATSWDARVNALTATAWDRGDPGRDDQYGYGVAQVWTALRQLSGATPMQERSPSPTPTPSPSQMNSPGPVGRMSMSLSASPASVVAGGVVRVSGRVSGPATVLSQGRVTVMSGATALAADVPVAANGTFSTAVKVVRDVSVSARFVAPGVTLSTGSMLLRAKLTVMGVASPGRVTLTVTNCATPVTVRVEKQTRGRWVAVASSTATAGKPVAFAVSPRTVYRFTVSGPGYSTPTTGLFVSR